MRRSQLLRWVEALSAGERALWEMAGAQVDICERLSLLEHRNALVHLRGELVSEAAKAEEEEVLTDK